MTPRYPIYIVSKGRHEKALGLTARFMLRDRVPFKLVIEPQEHDAYAESFGAENILALPFSNLGLGSIPARNWIWEHARASGARRHWIFDDNIRGVYRVFRGVRVNCDAGVAVSVIEDFVDRYENIAIAGMAYDFFCFPLGSCRLPPYWLNVHIYSSLLIDNALEYRWRGRYNEDTDLCLQVLSGGWCTVLVNVFCIKKTRTMKMRGGNTDHLYQDNGRLLMARSLERAWPGVVDVRRRFHRPQHVVRNQWRMFDTKLKRRADVDWSSLQQPDEYGLKLVQVKPVKSDEVAALMGAANGPDPRR